MKRFLFIIGLALCAIVAAAQTPKDVKLVFTEASDLNLIGKIHKETPNPYHRVDTVKFKGFTKGENRQVRCPAGLAVLFKTNSTIITVQTDWGWEYSSVATMPIAYRGYDLYIKKDGKWLWAASGAQKHGADSEKNLTLIEHMDNSEKECLLYLPMYSEIYSCKLGIQEGAFIEPIESPFRHRIGIFGSSYTHGISTSRAGMSYPMQLMRSTGLQFLSLGCSGNSKLQPYFADVLCAAEVDALVFDSFSNPHAEMIEERLFPFIEKIQTAHPDIPLIFQQTIYREKRNFNMAEDAKEAAKQETAARLMAEACKKYKNVYFIQTNATAPSHETTVDGIHPDDYGYTLWAKSIEKPILEILAKYGITCAKSPKEDTKHDWTEASDLTLCGKLMDTPNPYHRVDTVKYKGFTKTENGQVRMSSGISVAFRTNSPEIYVKTKYGIEKGIILVIADLYQLFLNVSCLFFVYIGFSATKLARHFGDSFKISVKITVHIYGKYRGCVIVRRQYRCILRLVLIRQSVISLARKPLKPSAMVVTRVKSDKHFHKPAASSHSVVFQPSNPLFASLVCGM